MTHSMWYAGILPILLALGACGSNHPIEPDANFPLTGDYRLTSYRGSTVPVDLGPLPTKDGGVQECHSIVTGGALQLNEATHLFHYDYEIQNSCTHASLGNLGSSGTFSWDGDKLKFTIQSSDGPIHFTGTVAQDRVRFYELEYERIQSK